MFVSKLPANLQFQWSLKVKGGRVGLLTPFFLSHDFPH